MGRSKLILVFIILVLAVMSLTGCSAVQNLFATPSSTSTATPTPTATPTTTPTPTSTPQPPILMVPCVFTTDCPDALTIEAITGSDAVAGVVSNVEIPVNQQVHLFVGWISSDEETLKQNLPHIQWFLTVDGQNYFQDAWVTRGQAQDMEDPTIYYPGYWIGAAFSGWRVGEPHFIRYGYILDAPINNGWEDYEEGYTLVYSWYFQPTDGLSP